MPVKVAINGFGRIGRNVLKCILNDRDSACLFEVVAINDLTDPKTLAHLFKYDSVQGINPAKIEVNDDDGAIINKKINNILLSMHTKKTTTTSNMQRTIVLLLQNEKPW